VLTKRPATVRSIHKISFDLDVRSPMACRETAQFRVYFNDIWRELDVHV